MLMLAVPIASSSSWDYEPTNDNFVLSSDGSQSDPYAVNMLAGDQYSYTITTNLPSTYTITSGNLSNVGFSFETNVINGTAKEGKESICITATSTDGPVQTKTQWIQFNVYNVLTLSGTITQNAWANAAYSSTITVTDVDPDATSETTLTLNSAATTAGYTITKVNETSWTLARDAGKATAGSTEVVVTATSNAGGIDQTKTMSATVTTYSSVGFTSTPANHDGQGTTVWLIAGTGSWTYTPVATPAGSSITATGLNSHITFANGTLTVTKTVFDSAKVTLTASSSSGGSAKTATQTLDIRVWDELEFLSSPSIENITHTVDGRTYTFNVKAANYNSIAWDVNGKTVGENSDTLTYDFSNDTAGTYTVRATAMDQIGRTATASTTVLLEANEGDDPAPVNPDASDKDYVQFLKDNIAFIILLAIGILVLAYGLKEEETWIIIVGIVIIAASIACIYCAYAGIDLVNSVKDWFDGLKGGSK